jgi:hypothetical protein
MKLSTAFLLLAPAAGFAPVSTNSRLSTTLQMSSTETKVRHRCPSKDSRCATEDTGQILFMPQRVDYGHLKYDDF